MEKLLFVLPSSLEEALMASTVLANYLITRMVTGRDSNNVTVVCPSKAVSFVKQSWYWANVVEEATQEQIEEAEMTFEFDTRGSYLMAKEVRKSIGDCFAIQLGVGLMQTLPAILVEDTPVDPHRILVASRHQDDGRDLTWFWPYEQEFCNLLEEEDVPYSWLRPDAEWDEMRQAVGRAEVVVGVRGTPTLMAAGANKVLMELSADYNGHSEWFRKSKASNYRLMYGDLNNMTAEFVWKQTKLLVAKVFGKRETEAQTSEGSYVRP